MATNKTERLIDKLPEQNNSFNIYTRERQQTYTQEISSGQTKTFIQCGTEQRQIVQ